MKKNRLLQINIFFIIFFVCPFVQADQETDAAKQLANPLASLISVPIQVNYDENIGANNKGSVWRTNIQPVIPFSFSENWTVISRTILPLVDQSNIPVNGINKSGIGDITQSFFFSPSKPTSGGYIWGAGPAFLLDTAADETLGSEKWAAGPTGVILTQKGPWTYGALANHLESFAGKNNRADVSATLLQPFVSYILPTHTTIGFNLESTYNWEAEEWSVPVNLSVSQLLKAGDQLYQVGLGIRYWAEAPDNGPEDWGARLTVVFLFPK